LEEEQNIKQQQQQQQKNEKAENKQMPMGSIVRKSNHYTQYEGIDFANLNIQDFVKIKQLGRGDVGTVYLVRLKNTKFYFAMKEIVKDEMIKRKKIRRVLTEREILATIDHPFVVTLYCSFQSKDKLYFIMEYCHGGEFFAFLQSQKKKSLPEEAVQFYAAEVLLALEFLHCKGCIYRDLKPENILLTRTGHIRLTDFDLSKQTITPEVPKVSRSIFKPMTNAKISTRQLQQFNSFVGTPEYIAPEIVNGSGHTSTVDWWTYGIFLYEMLYGTTPYKGKTQQQTFDNIRISKKLSFPPTPSGTDLSKSCKDLIKKLLHPDTKKRLGAKHGAADIKKHQFFSSLGRMGLIRNLQPPIKVDFIEPEIIEAKCNHHRKGTEDIGLLPSEEMAYSNPFKAFRYAAKDNKDMYGTGKHLSSDTSSTDSA